MKVFLSTHLLFSTLAIACTTNDATKKPPENTLVEASIVYNKRAIFLATDHEFGISLDTQHNLTPSISHQPDVKNADVTLRLSRELQTDGTTMVVLHVHNNIKQRLEMDATANSLSNKHLSLSPGFSACRLWPHSTLQSVDIRNMRIMK